MNENRLAGMLCLEQRRVDPAVSRALFDAGSLDERTTIAAATALMAGEPRRALRTLGNLHSPDAAALRYLATALDRNWFPGDVGAVITAEDISALAAIQPPANDTLVCDLAGRFLPNLISLRASITTAPPGQHADTLAAVLRDFAGRRPDTGPGPVRSYAALAVADLAWAAGDLWQSQHAVDEAVTLAAGDVAAQAHAALVQGDWQAEPRGRPESLGLQLTGMAPPATAVSRDLDAAADLYARAERGWILVGSQSGVAAAALRQAHVARLRGENVRRDAQRARAESLATAAGSTALAMLAKLHGVIDRLADGDLEDDEWPDQVAAWATTEGSLSYARGLVRVLAAQVRTWRAEGAFVRARHGLRLAGRLAAKVGAEAETQVVAVDLADQYGEIYRPAAIVAADQRLSALLAGAKTWDALDFITAAYRAMTVFGAGNRGASAPLVRLGIERLRLLLDRIPQGLSGDEAKMVTKVSEELRRSLATAGAVAQLYEGLELRRTGRPEESNDALGVALVEARHLGDRMIECMVLTAQRRDAEALDAARELFWSGAISPSMAAQLFVGLRRPVEAAAAVAHESLIPYWITADTAWTVTARDAQLRLLRGEPTEAVWLAEEGLRLFAERQARLGRDVLRTAATDVPEAAALVDTCVLAHLDLAVAGLEAGDATAAYAHKIQALRVADQTRGLALHTGDLTRWVGDEERAALRRWLRTGSRWAANYERIVATLARGEVPADADVAVVTAERELDEAEEEVARLAPAVLAERTAPALDLAAIRDNLPPEAVLLAYYAHRDELVGWAMTRSALRVVRQDCRADDLSALAVRAHGVFSRRLPARGEIGELTRYLLEPFRAELDEHPRVLIAPHAALSQLPIHAFPWGGAVLGANHVVSYLPTIGLLARPGAGLPPQTDGALLVGDPATAPVRGLARLPGTASEVLTAAAVLPGSKVLIGTDATEEAVSRLSRGRPILHLAAHGLLEPDSPNLARVVLTGRDELTVGDLMGLDLAAELLVLSACHTGQGVATAAGDVIGLTRAALVAGARHVIVSLWPVDDEAGALVMSGFYRRLTSGASVAASLQLAQLDVAGLGVRGRAEAYAELAREAGLPVAVEKVDDDGSSGGTARAGRGFSLAGDATGHDAYFWAPFVHVGG